MDKQQIKPVGMPSSYDKEDVTLLLKDITGLVAPKSTEERERQIQSGRHYCEMLPMEYKPTDLYMNTYTQALKDFSKDVAEAVGRLSHKIFEMHKAKENQLVFVSLARAGIPVGILLKRYYQWRFQIDIPHYSISIIRGRGIDKIAMNYMLQHHSPESLLFVDGWVGKGAILGELQKEISQFPHVSPQLAVLADPANVTELHGTQKDILIPSACLNATVSGLISRTFLREDIIGKEDFHGALYYKELAEVDQSKAFLEEVEGHFQRDFSPEPSTLVGKGVDEVRKIATKYGISDINLVKPGIGETTRVLLRRVPWKILVSEKEAKNPALTPILQLAKERHVPVEYEPLSHYLVCGLIKNMGDV